MTLLDQIIEFSKNPQISDVPLSYPFPLIADSILETLEIDPQNPNPNPNSYSPIIPLTGFNVSDVDSSIIESNRRLFVDLKTMLNNPIWMSLPMLINLVTPFLEKIMLDKFGGVGDLEMGVDGCDHLCKLIAKFGSFVGRDVMGLIVEVSFAIENWKILRVMIENKLVDHENCSYFLANLVKKSRTDLICLFVKHYRDFSASDLRVLLEYFLFRSVDGFHSMMEVRKEWESEALFAIEKASDKLGGMNVGLAKEAALLLTVAYDGFSSWELCLHFLVSSCVDDVVFSSAVSKLNANELLGLIRYLGKWLRKYERFPQVTPYPKDAVTFGMNLLQWVPRLEDVVKCYGLVVDEHFSSLAMHVEFHDELKAIEEVVASMASEGKLRCSVANLMAILKPEP
ncbi:hypothetical protein vseg_003071 [Gypsophila vaccaria]